jgi:dolichol-phosphate mannosyltransferase
MAELPSRLVIMIPTYNERENIGELIHGILTLTTACDLAILVVDDNSPDGTAEVVAEISRRDPRVQSLVRQEERGRGLAGIEGFRRSLDLGADFIIEMDGDGSHQPSSIPSLLEGARRADLVLGSRFVPGGKDAERSPGRRLITVLVRSFIRRYFRIPVNDVSSGFRCFRREVLARMGLDSLVSTGPSVVLEVLYKAYRLGFTIGEVPIVFIDRKKGRTKLTGRTLWKTLLMALRIKRMYENVEPLVKR